MADGKQTLLKVGQKFSSFEEVKSAIARYEEKNYTNLYVSDSRTIASTLKRTPNRVIKPGPKYSHLNYACVAGGRVDKDGNFLEVAALNEIHNHECDEVLYVLYAVIRFSLRIVPKFHFFCPLGKSAVCMEWLIVFT